MADNLGTERAESLSNRRTALLADARKHFAQLTDTSDPVALKTEIDKLLKKANLSYEALDPSGRSPAAAIRSSIDTIVALQGIRDPGAAAPALAVPGMREKAVAVAQHVGKGLAIGAVPVVRLHRRIGRIAVTRPLALLALVANGILVGCLLPFTIVSTILSYRDTGLSDAFYDQELYIAAPLLLTAAAFAVALVRFAHWQYDRCFRIAAPVSLVVVGLAVFVSATEPALFNQLTDRVQSGLRPPVLVPQAAPSQMWTGHR